jgi:NhaA family Na+:H+ antiporter
MHDRLFAHPDALEPTDLVDHAAALGLDVERFARSLGAGDHAARVRKDVASAEASGAEGTPTFFVNGRRLLGRYDADALLAALLDGEELPPTAEAPAPTRWHLPDDGVGPTALDLEEIKIEPVSDAYPRLSDGQIATLAQFGERRPITRGEPLFPADDSAADFAVVLSGAVAMVLGYGERNFVGRVHGPRSFIGELALLRGETTLTTPVGARDGEVLVVPAERFPEALAADLELRDIISRAYLLRRAMLLAKQNAGDVTPP